MVSQKQSKKRICMVTASNLDYDTRILSEIQTLAANYDVEIITPGYYKPPVKPNFRFKVAAHKFSKKFPREVARVLNLLAIIKEVKKTSADIYHAHDLPGLFCAVLGNVGKKTTIYYDSHELWSDVNLFGFWKIFRWPFRWLERALLPKVSAIITVNDSIADILKKRFNKPTLSLYNYPVLRQTNKELGQRKQKIILYIGAFRKGRGLMNIIHAAKHLDDSCKFVLIGYGREEKKIRLLIQELKLEDKVIIKPPLQPDQLISTISQASVGLCLIENSSLSYFYSSPNKLFQYVAAEVPILASDFPEHRKVVLGEKIGEVASHNDPRSIAETIKKMLLPNIQKFYRQNLKGLTKNKYNWQLNIGKLINFYGTNNFAGARDFTLKKYAEICAHLVNHYQIITFAESLKPNRPKKFAILRHDIDRMPENALEFAKLEASMGLKGSYYFRSYQLQTALPIIKQVAALGHEVGYHYECLDQAEGNQEEALEIFQKYLSEFRTIASIETIAMHGNPLTNFNNRHLWAKGDLQKYNILGETYLDLARGTFYFSDTGRTWSNRFKVKDIPVRTNHEHRRFKIETTDDLINMVENANIKQLCIVTHPERWNDNWLKWVGYLCLDKIVQVVKRLKK